MKPLSAITAPILAQLYAERAHHLDCIEAELRQMVAANNERNERLAAGLRRQDKGKAEQ